MKTLNLLIKIALFFFTCQTTRLTLTLFGPSVPIGVTGGPIVLVIFDAYFDNYTWFCRKSSIASTGANCRHRWQRLRFRGLGVFQPFQQELLQDHTGEPQVIKKMAAAISAEWRYRPWPSSQWWPKFCPDLDPDLKSSGARRTDVSSLHDDVMAKPVQLQSQ